MGMTDYWYATIQPTTTYRITGVRRVEDRRSITCFATCPCSIQLTGNTVSYEVVPDIRGMNNRITAYNPISREC